MKQKDYTDYRVKLLFITGMILVFIILFTSFLYSKQSVTGSFKVRNSESISNMNLKFYLNKSGGYFIFNTSAIACLKINNKMSGK